MFATGKDPRTLHTLSIVYQFEHKGSAMYSIIFHIAKHQQSWNWMYRRLNGAAIQTFSEIVKPYEASAVKIDKFAIGRSLWRAIYQLTDMVTYTIRIW